MLKVRRMLALGVTDIHSVLRTDYPIMYFSIQIRVSKSLLIITHNTRGIDLFYHWSFLCIYHDWQLSERHCCFFSLRLALPKILEWQTLSRRAVYISSFVFISNIYFSPFIVCITPILPNQNHFDWWSETTVLLWFTMQD